jgi:hypothetical protein
MKSFKEIRETTYTDGYMAIGHDKKSKVDLWLYANRKLKIVKISDASTQTHQNTFGKILDIPNAIFGRVDHVKQKISAYVGNADNHIIFDALYELQRRHPDYEILKFGFNNRYLGTFKDMNEEIDLYEYVPVWTSIGHDPPYDKIQIWWMESGSFAVRDDPEGKMTHNRYWRDEDIKTPSFWGRIDHRKKAISIQARRDIMMPEKKVVRVASALKRLLSVKDYDVYYYPVDDKAYQLVESSTPPKSWLSVGHYGKNSEIWWRETGEIKTTEAIFGLTHNRYFMQQNIKDVDFVGRVDHDTKTISLRGWRLGSIIHPAKISYVKKQLIRKFGSDYYIWYFAEEGAAELISEAYISYEPNVKSWTKAPKLLYYLDIGHGHGESTENSYWLTDHKGRVRVYDIPSGEDPYAHGHGTHKNLNSAVAYGRIDHAKKIISFVPQNNNESLLYSIAFDLQDRYRKYEIYRMDDGYLPRIFNK